MRCVHIEGIYKYLQRSKLLWVHFLKLTVVIQYIARKWNGVINVKFSIQENVGVETEAKEHALPKCFSVTIALFGHSHGIKIHEGFKF